MPYITREDGERFVVPSYRDILSTKKTALLKKEVMMLSAKYGEYITLQRKTSEQYEVAFSPDTGYLLGETVWHHFKRPLDLIYCEAIPNTTEAILVIVKSGSVYLDGSFPMDSIPEELIVFKTQQNNFDIYVHGDVPLSQAPEEGKFALQSSSVKSFTVVPTSVFAALPRVKAFQLKLVDQVLRTQGIGVFPIKKLVGFFVVLGLLWMGFTYFSTHKKEIPQILVQAVNPYQSYYDALTSPDPSYEINILTKNIAVLYTAPGWYPESIAFTAQSIKAKMMSQGMRTNVLFQWGKRNHIDIVLEKDGFYAVMHPYFYNRSPSLIIAPVRDLIAGLIDNLSYILPGNTIKMNNIIDKGKYNEASITITFSQITLSTLGLIGEQLKQLPMVLSSVDMQTTGDGSLSGTITLKVLGS